MTSLKDLHAANIARQAEWCPDQVPDLSFRGNELGGECGEAQNVIKKLERERLGWRGSRSTTDQLAEELADVVICADLCAVTAGIDLAAAVVAKFNATSDRYELTTKLAPADGWVEIAVATEDPPHGRWLETYREGEDASTMALCHRGPGDEDELIWVAPSGHDTVANAGSYAPPTHYRRPLAVLTSARVGGSHG